MRGAALLERFELLVGEHVLALLELVALDHVAALDFLAVLRAGVLLLQARAILLVEQVERDRGLRLAAANSCTARHEADETWRNR